MIKVLLDYKNDALTLTDYVKDYFKLQVIGMWKRQMNLKT